MKQDILKLINMRDVETEKIEWLWYPYIPFGKRMYRINHTISKPPVMLAL